jgi:hypothetical protein
MAKINDITRLKTNNLQYEMVRIPYTYTIIIPISNKTVSPLLYSYLTIMFSGKRFLCGMWRVKRGNKFHIICPVYKPEILTLAGTDVVLRQAFTVKAFLCLDFNNS